MTRQQESAIARAYRSVRTVHRASYRAFFTELFHSFGEDRVHGSSAQLGYFFFFSIFPTFVFLLAVTGLVGGGNSVRDALARHISTVVPATTSDLVQQTLRVHHRTRTLLISGFLALWSSTEGMAAVCEAMNGVHDVRESRSYWRVRLTSLRMALATGALLLLAFGGMAWTDRFAISAHGHFIEWIAIKTVQWAFALVCLAIVFALTYHWAPNVEDREWSWLSAGAAVGILLWALAAAGLRIYFHFSHWSATTYGTVGAVMILLVWFYFAGFALLAGAEVNAVMEDFAARHGDARATAKGAKEPETPTAKR